MKKEEFFLFIGVVVIGIVLVDFLRPIVAKMGITI